MKASNLVRSILADAAAAAFMLTTVSSTAAELQPLVVAGIPPDLVAIKHPVPAYPRVAQTLKIGGVVRLSLQIDRGQAVSVTAKSGPPFLADYSVRWVRHSWQFKPSVSGEYLLPIYYKLRA